MTLDTGVTIPLDQDNPYFNYVCFVVVTETNTLKQSIVAFSVIRNCKHICQNFSIGVHDEAVMFVLCNINTNTNHKNTPGNVFRCCLEPQTSLLM